MLDKSMQKINLSDFPSLLKEWHPSKNDCDLSCLNSSQMIWWRCPLGPDHEWEARLCYRIIRGDGCPCCANRKVVESNCLATTHPELSQQWHPDNDFLPEEVTAGSNKKVTWQCSAADDHVWKTSISHRTIKRSGCPFCVGLRASSTNNAESKMTELQLSQWSSRNKLKPNQVSPSSMKKVWWRCGNGHEWQASLNNRLGHNQDCPYCSGKKADSTSSILARHPNLCEEWDDDVDPNTVLPNSHKKYWWRCNQGHRWQASPNNRVASASGCPCCNESGGERLVSSVLQSMTVDFSRQYRFADCKVRRRLPFDFAVHKDRLGLIEFHGGQHYFAVSKFGGEAGLARTQTYDKIKEDYCRNNGIPLLVISYRDSKDVSRLVREFVEAL